MGLWEEVVDMVLKGQLERSFVMEYLGCGGGYTDLLRIKCIELNMYVHTHTHT